MNEGLRRRRFLQIASALGLGSELGPWASLRTITPLRADETRVKPEMVKFRPEIEPVVRLLEDTPRERALEVAIAAAQEGAFVQEFAGGIVPGGHPQHQAAAGGIQVSRGDGDQLGPRAGSIGGCRASAFCLCSGRSTISRRRRPQDVKEGDWVLAPVDESRLPKTNQAKGEFLRAMEAWDSTAADAAVAALCRGSGAAETMEPLWRMAVRDQRNIGHKAIFAAQSWRTLQTIGWEHAEPVVRSLVFGMLDLQGDSRPRPVGPYEANLENAGKIRQDWQIGRDDPGAAAALLQVIRQATPEAASAEAVKMLNQGISPGSLWDAAVLASCELMMHKPDILALHATTSTNALHYIFTASGDDTTRRLALLQAIGWQPMFRGRTKLTDSEGIDSLEDQSRPGDLERGRGGRRDLHDRQRGPQESGGQDSGLPGPRRLVGFDLRRGQTDDLSQRRREPSVQVWRGSGGGVPLVDRAEMARPDRRDVDVLLARCQVRRTARS